MQAPMSDERLAEIAEMDEEAVKGPWQWFGNTDSHDVYLATVDRGRIFIMGFERWGMRDARPIFQEHDTHNGMQSFQAHAIYERDYRNDFQGIDLPEARVLSEGRQAITQLVAEVKRLRRQLRATNYVHRAAYEQLAADYDGLVTFIANPVEDIDTVLSA